MPILNIISGRRRGSSTACPVGMEKLPAWPVKPFIGVCTEIVALSLQQVSGQLFAAVTVKIPES